MKTIRTKDKQVYLILPFLLLFACSPSAPNQFNNNEISNNSNTITSNNIVPANSPEPLPIITPLPLIINSPSTSINEPFIYQTKAGDTLKALSARFGVSLEEIISETSLSMNGFLEPNLTLTIPNKLADTTSEKILLSDAEIVYSTLASDFDIASFITNQNGYLASYEEYFMSTGTNTSAQVIDKVSLDNSINPMMIITILEYKSNWVLGNSEEFMTDDYPMDYFNSRKKKLYRQLTWLTNQLSEGYYGWRMGTLTNLTFDDGSTVRLHPALNAGTVAIHYLFSQMYAEQNYQFIIDAEKEFLQIYSSLFENTNITQYPQRDFIKGGLSQPKMILPFHTRQNWFYTSGPHGAWEQFGAIAALDFAPGADLPGCVSSDKWIVAPASGIVTRVEKGVIIINLDYDNNEHTGWSILLLHIGDLNNITEGKYIRTGDFLGHPSCEGGLSSGSHLHIARKYNGEWMAADGPAPFILSGWQAMNGKALYQGYLVRDDITIEACQCGTLSTKIVRNEEDPY